MMTALQALGGKRFRLVQVPIPACAATEVRIRVDAVTICTQWDLHLRRGQPMFPGHTFHLPYTVGQPGHEASGVVDAIGSDVRDLRVGDRVSVWRDPGHDVMGAYAQYVVRAADDAIRVPSLLPAWQTAAVELAMCVAASVQRLRDVAGIEGQRVAVSGLGPAGLIAVQLMRAEGAREITGIDPCEQRRAAAEALAPIRTLSPSEAESALPKRPHATVDVAVDCVGSARSVQFLMDRTREALGLFGVQREAYMYRPEHYDRLILCGYPGHHRRDAEYAVRCIERGALDLGAIVTHHYALDEYEQAIDQLEHQTAVKVCLHPWGVPEALRSARVLPDAESETLAAGRG
ncbi:MAG: alcohol dehydrogenase catalytic domain-containing protein [Fimbriimonadaceae bacterium]|nr:alcohol dehydrogenase catalytic domain-containing protein [Fimbriimonadaceae bacterium]